MTTQNAKNQIASDTVKVQLAALTLENNGLKKQVDSLQTENTNLKRQLTEVTNVVESDLKSDLMLRIMAKGDFKEADLEDLPIAQLQTIDETLSRSKGGDATFKPISAGTATEKSSRLTVGNLFGKTRTDILQMEGNF